MPATATKTDCYLKCEAPVVKVNLAIKNIHKYRRTIIPFILTTLIALLIIREKGHDSFSPLDGNS